MPKVIAGGFILSLASLFSYMAIPEQNCFTDVTGTHCEQSSAQSGSFIAAILAGGGSLILAGYYGVSVLLGKAHDVTKQ